MYMLKTDGWYLERATFLAGGIVVLSSVILSQVHSPWWLLLTGLAGFNLIVLGITGFCLMANILAKFGIKPRLNKNQ